MARMGWRGVGARERERGASDGETRWRRGKLKGKWNAGGIIYHRMHREGGREMRIWRKLCEEEEEETQAI